MPYAPQHKQETRERILRSARRLFNRKGLAEVTIDEIMADAGLTRGGFYRHFATKEELYSEALLQFICRNPPEEWQRKHVNPCAEGVALARMIVGAYLSQEHLYDRDGSCPTVGLPSDVSRSSDAVKRAFRMVMDSMLSVFVANLHGPGARERGLALVSVCVGAMVVARGRRRSRLGRSIPQGSPKARTCHFRLGDPVSQRLTAQQLKVRDGLVPVEHGVTGQVEHAVTKRELAIWPPARVVRGRHPTRDDRTPLIPGPT